MADIGTLVNWRPIAVNQSPSNSVGSQPLIANDSQTGIFHTMAGTMQ